MYLHKTGTSHATLARRLGVDPSYISHIVHGRKLPSLTMAQKIANETNVPIESFLQVSR